MLGTHHFLSMNCVLPAAWASAALLATRALVLGDRRAWPWFGLVCGVALEAKHSTLFFGAALFVGILLSPYRRALLTKGPWVGAAIAGLVLLPNLVWEQTSGCWSSCTTRRRRRWWRWGPSIPRSEALAPSAGRGRVRTTGRWCLRRASRLGERAAVCLARRPHRLLVGGPSRRVHAPAAGIEASHGDGDDDALRVLGAASVRVDGGDDARSGCLGEPGTRRALAGGGFAGVGSRRPRSGRGRCRRARDEVHEGERDRRARPTPTRAVGPRRHFVHATLYPGPPKKKKAPEFASA